MSLHTFSFKGYGLAVDDADPKKMAKFLSDHASALTDYFEKNNEDADEAVKRALKHIRKAYDFDEANEAAALHSEGNILTFLATALNDEYKSDNFMVVPAFEDTPAYILYEATYPWELTHADMHLTEEKLKKMFIRFAEDIGIAADAKYQDLVYTV